MTDITEQAQRNELLIANGQQIADLLRHLADNEIDSDYFAVVSECESYGQETDAELSITEFALRAAGYVDELVEALEKAQQRIAETESSGIASGILRCTECSFVLTKNIISITADTITTVEIEPEPCPNGCGQLQPVAWKALAIQLMSTTKQGLSDLLEAKKRIEELESDLSEWTDCKHDGATYYDMSGQERCGRCGADI